MKKFLIAFCFLGFLQANAQVTLKPGVKAGLNLSKFTNSEATNKTDFYLGGFMAIKFAKIYTLQPELIYSRQGAVRNVYYYPLYTSYNPVFQSSRKEVKYSLDYLGLNVINKFTFGSGFQVVVGPAIDFKVSDNFSENNAEKPIGVDIALVGGLGYSYNNFTFEARVKQGMADIFGDNYNQTVDNNNNGNYDEVVLNQLFQFGVSYTFDVK
jgi:hypothetical protein